MRAWQSQTRRESTTWLAKWLQLGRAPQAAAEAVEEAVLPDGALVAS